MSVLKKAYALLIGVGNDLPITVRDANAIRNILADQGIVGYPRENILLLTEKEASRDGILAAFDQLIDRIDEDSSVLIFYSGHGGTYLDNDILNEGEKKPESENHRHYYLLPNNFDAENFDETWVTADELKEKIRAISSRRIVMLLDCCHAAGMTKSSQPFTTPERVKSLKNPEVMAQEIEGGQGISIISSCREDQQSFILDGDTNSLFTKCLIEVLKGKHTTQADDPYIRITEVTQYLFKRIPELIENQKPYVNLQIYDDFILSKRPNHKIENVELIEETAVLEDYAAVKTSFRKEVKANNLLLFVHGFTGEASETFGGTPELLMKDSRFNGWDMLPLGYTSTIRANHGNQVWASQVEIEMMADFLATSLKTNFSKYHRISILAHGIGGLITQLALVNLPDDILSKLNHVLIYGCPNAGLPNEFLEHTEHEEFEFLVEEGEFITSLRTKWDKKFKSQTSFKVKLIAATEDEYVPIQSNFKGIKNAEEIIINGDHFSIVKPTDEQDESYQLVVQNLLDNKFLHQITSAEEVNLTLGEYQAVIDRLLPNKNELDERGIQSLCFALEGLDRGQEAIEILSDKKYADESGKLQSILAGRFKRLFLKSYTKKDGENAFRLYQSAFKIAEEKNDFRNKYYNAINLAFLSIVFQNDISQMQLYNELVKESLVQDPFPSLWKIATEAECALYSANFDKAKQHYEKAASMAGIREKLSIYTNAYTAYTHLMNTDHGDDDMIRFLQKTFL